MNVTFFHDLDPYGLLNYDDLDERLSKLNSFVKEAEEGNVEPGSYYTDGTFFPPVKVEGELLDSAFNNRYCAIVLVKEDCYG